VDQKRRRQEAAHDREMLEEGCGLPDPIQALEAPERMRDQRGDDRETGE
jgi:hypothetical protein